MTFLMLRSSWPLIPMEVAIFQNGIGQFINWPRPQRKCGPDLVQKREVKKIRRKLHPSCYTYLALNRSVCKCLLLCSNVLLAPKGIDIPQMTEKLQSLSTRKTFQPLEPIADIDVKLFLKNEYENGILSVIALNQKQSAQNIRKTTWSHTKRIWQTEKNKIANAMLESKTSYLDFAAPVEESFVQEIPSAKSMLSHEEMVYAKEVAEYNKTIMTGLVYPNLINNFYAVSKSFNDKVSNFLFTLLYCCIFLTVLMPSIFITESYRIVGNG